MSNPSNQERRSSERFDFDAGVDIYVDTQITGGECLNVSQGGLRFNGPEPLPMTLRLNIDGEREERQARLIFAEMQADGRTTYGIEFVDDEMFMEE